MNYYVADTHWCHSNIIKFCTRPFASVEEMNEAMIERWNSKVTKKDTVYHLGDVVFRGSFSQTKEILDRLNGKIILIKGNHDDERDLKKLTYRFELIDKLLEIKDSFINHNIVLCHYPLASWRSKGRGAYHLYGHVHNNLHQHNLSLDVGVDVHDFYPLSSLEIDEKIKAKQIEQNIIVKPHDP